MSGREQKEMKKDHEDVQEEIQQAVCADLPGCSVHVGWRISREGGA